MRFATGDTRELWRYLAFSEVVDRDSEGDTIDREVSGRISDDPEQPPPRRGDSRRRQALYSFQHGPSWAFATHELRAAADALAATSSPAEGAARVRAGG